MNRSHLVLASCFIILFSTFWGCKVDDTPELIQSQIHFNSVAIVGNESVVYDSLLYINAAGNLFSVTRLQFYLSGFQFHHSIDGWIGNDGAFYFDPLKGKISPIYLDLSKTGECDSVRFIFGLSEALNTDGGLPNTTDNLNMSWPTQMGGGYHFLKFEGRFRDSSGITRGFAMHVGTNNCREEITIPIGFMLQPGQQKMEVSVDVNELVSSPNVFDFNTNYYTMGIDSLMIHLSENAQSAFNINIQ